MRPTSGGVTVCQADITKSVASTTPEICEVTNTDPAGLVKHEYGWFNVEGKAAGTCKYTVTFPGGADGAGVTQEFEYPIEP